MLAQRPHRVSALEQDFAAPRPPVVETSRRRRRASEGRRAPSARSIHVSTLRGPGRRMAMRRRLSAGGGGGLDMRRCTLPHYRSARGWPREREIRGRRCWPSPATNRRPAHASSRMRSSPCVGDTPATPPRRSDGGIAKNSVGAPGHGVANPRVASAL
ncbi:hypothetical protein PsYK624_135680 [Phanerochaete sordida]|uniref:Uncharacterized protein n=1 Tax=Phanerochaete sordida TaxID=48140 RepID=A0A9P3GL70_9APHY|nr:hypothetical protein PsYK624_135680 [Phanerochaete sordida]